MLFHPAISSKPMLFLRLPLFQRCFNASKNQICKKFVHEADVCDWPEISCDFGLFRFWQHLEQRFAPRAWDFTMSQNSVHDVENSAPNVLRSKVQEFCDQPTFIRSFVCLHPLDCDLQLLQIPICFCKLRWWRWIARMPAENIFEHVCKVVWWRLIGNLTPNAML